MNMGEVETFISNHKRIRRKMDAAGKKGMCETKDELIKSGIKVSPAEWVLHKRVFEMHGYSLEALTDVHCNKDALKELYERLSTSTK